MDTASAAFAAHLVAGMPDALVYADADGRIGYWNGGATRIFGFTRAEALGKSLDLIIPEGLRKRHWDGYEVTMRTGETRYGDGQLLSVPALRKDGSRISVEFTIVPFKDEAGRMIGIAAVMRDVTERFEELRSLRKQVATLEATQPAEQKKGLMMCDTMVALGSAVAGGGVLFAKNSDRQPNEAQNLELIPRRRHRSGATVKLTYIEVPQVRETNAVLLSRPFWIWGAEIGANEHGVAIGNEAVYARIPSGRKPGMIGMDLLRLGLERGSSAREALDVILELLETHGQSGNCGHRRRQFYDNSFIIADAGEAYVLETFARHYAVEQVRGIRTISNALSIGTRHERRSEGLTELARERGWYRGNGRIDFAASFADAAREAPGEGRARCARSTEFLRGRNAPLGSSDMMTVLRDHGGDSRGWRPDEGTRRTICMHAHPAIGRRGQTTAAMVSELRDGRVLHWVTGSAAPCTSVFRPVMIEHGLPDRLRAATDRFSGNARWWRHEKLHRAILADYPDRHAAIATERDALERQMQARMKSVLKDRGPAAAKRQRAAIEACWHDADAAEARWLQLVDSMPVSRPAAASHRRAWARLSRLAGLAAPSRSSRAKKQPALTGRARSQARSS